MTTKAIARKLLTDHPDVLSEAEFSSLVVDVARVGGWTLRYHTHNSRRSPKGFLDWTFFHPGRQRASRELLPELLFVELKRQDGKVKPDQQAWLDAFRALEDALYSPAMPYWQPVRARVWRPADWPEVVETLTGRTPQ